MHLIQFVHKLFLVFIVLGFMACLKGKHPKIPQVPVAYVDSAFLSYFQKQQGIIAGEGARSLVLKDGRTLWLFGNAHLDNMNGSGLIPCTTNVRNAAMLSDASMQFTTLNGLGQDFIPTNEAGKWFTPLHAYQYADTLFIFARKMGGLSNNRTYLAKFHYPDLQFLRLDSMLINNTIYGYSVFIDQQKGFGYVYGLYNPQSLEHNKMYVARFPMNNIHGTWQFYSSTLQNWQDFATAATTQALVPGENFAVRNVLNKYVLLTQEYGKACNTGTGVYAQTGAQPWGEFLNVHKIFTLEESLQGNTPATWGVCMHPQYLDGAAELLITLSIGGYEPCVPTCQGGWDNPDYYRIRTFKLGLKAIDPAY